ncbi:response regulator [Hyalangium minutum]|uniref:DNA-binding response regulator KdpE n=1 Tax=Hyalangium minutum TaxID=394096 RepID=A0A085WMF2_9BACT|nr:response regulator [Hyalangium minutum]AYM52376.1 response regulator receiver domain protein [Hyalangium minutum]KFE68865.1 DNA-binding response regulator KdpE [Hyalangium minutum]
MAPRILVVDDNQELLSLLTQLFEDAGYEVSAASRGKQATELAKGQALSAAVIDVLLPDMMGYHLADALRKEQPQVPLLFITGVFKGGKHAIEARQKYAAAGYFEKPFEAQKLLEAVAKLVPPEKKATPPAPRPQDAFEVELDIDVEEEGPQDAMELTGRIKVTGGGNLSAEIRGANLTASPMQKGPVTVVRHPQPGRPPDPVPAGAGGPGMRRGELKDNLPSLITAFFLSKETGELGVQRGKVKKVVYFEHGTPVFALSNLLSDRFGQFLVRVGKIRPEQLQDAATVATQTQRRTGDILVERGLLKDTERLYYVGQQVKAIIYSLFSWEDGTYVMSFKEKATAESIKLDLHPANLIVRGVKKLYKPERLRRLLRPEDRLIPAVAPSYNLSEVELERWEAELLPRVDGNRTVAELLAYANRPEQVVYGFLVAMQSLGVLDRRQ